MSFANEAFIIIIKRGKLITPFIIIAILLFMFVHLGDASPRIGSYQPAFGTFIGRIRAYSTRISGQVSRPSQIYRKVTSSLIDRSMFSSMRRFLRSSVLTDRASAYIYCSISVMGLFRSTSSTRGIYLYAISVTSVKDPTLTSG